MNAVEIPISCDAAHFSQEHLIFGRTYTLEFEWIERECYWVMHLLDHHEEPIALGLKVMADWPFFIDRETRTVFFLLSKTNKSELNRESLRSDFILVAYEAV